MNSNGGGIVPVFAPCFFSVRECGKKEVIFSAGIFFLSPGLLT